MRRSITRLPWRQCCRRSFVSRVRIPPSPATNEAASPTHGSSDFDRKALAAAVSSHQIPEAPSILSTLPSNVVETTKKSTDRRIDSEQQEPWSPGQAVPTGYNAQIYGICADLAKKGQNPSRADLDQLFRLMWHDSPYGELKEEAMAVFREMGKEGIVPTKDGFRPLFSITSKGGDVIAQDELVQALIEHKIHLDTHMLHSLIEGLMRNNEIERAFLFLRDLRAQGVIPKRNTYNLLIGVCGDSHDAEEMFRLLLDFKDTWGDNSIHEHTWWIALDVCAEEGYLPGLLYCWRTLQNVRNIEFPEGLCLKVLSVAAEHAHPALAVSVFDELAKISVAWDERHFLPLIQAYVRAEDIRQAFIVLNIMRERSVTPPTIRSIETLVQAIAVDTKSLDTAYFILEDLAKQEGQKVDLVAFSSLLEACVRLKDASRAVATYQDAAKFGVTPDLETFNILLRAVQQVAHIDLMMTILKDMKAAGLSPNEETFTAVILTCVLQPPPQHEAAFPYLEDMKAHGYIPSSGIYQAFIKKCVFGNDDRVYALLDEMKNMGHGTTTIVNWIQETTRKLSMGAPHKFKDFQENRVERMRTAREEDRQATRTVFSTLGRTENADDQVEAEIIEKIKEQGLIA